MGSDAQEVLHRMDRIATALEGIEASGLFKRAPSSPEPLVADAAKVHAAMLRARVNDLEHVQAQLDAEITKSALLRQAYESEKVEHNRLDAAVAQLKKERDEANTSRDAAYRGQDELDKLCAKYMKERDQANAENRDGATNVQIDSLKRQLANARDQRKTYANLIEHIKTSIEAATDSDLEVM